MSAIEIALAPEHKTGLGEWLRAGRIFESAGYKQRALEAYQQALTLDPGSEIAKSGLDRIQK
jgi:predicted TPR repeat methyltransferase